MKLIVHAREFEQTQFSIQQKQLDVPDILIPAPERRRLPRTGAGVAALIEQRGLAIATWIVDASHGGVRLQIIGDHELLPGDQVDLKLSVETSLSARMRWSNSGQIGLAFEQWAPDVFDLLSGEHRGNNHFLDVLRWQRKARAPSIGARLPAARIR